MSTRPSCAPLSRRAFLTSTSAAALAAAACAPAPSGGGQSATTSQPQDLIGDGRKRRILLRGGVVLTLDPKIGDFENADVLIDGKTIAQGLLAGAWPQETYGSVVQNIWTAGRIADSANPSKVIWDLGRVPYDPEDCYIAQ